MPGAGTPKHENSYYKGTAEGGCARFPNSMFVFILVLMLFESWTKND
jgi:hypothetical protein